MANNFHAWFKEDGAQDTVCMNCGTVQTEANIDEYCDPSTAVNKQDKEIQIGTSEEAGS